LIELTPGLSLPAMKKASARELKHDPATVPKSSEAGWQAGLQKSGNSQQKTATSKRSDFMARLKSTYGSKVLAVTATDLLADERGNR
jgi:hypothetical protein